MQRRAVDAWNRRHGDELRLLQGLEVEVLEDGRLDLPRIARAGAASGGRRAHRARRAPRPDRPPAARPRGARGVGAGAPALPAVRPAERPARQLGAGLPARRRDRRARSRSTASRAARTSTRVLPRWPPRPAAASCSPPTPTTRATWSSTATPPRWPCTPGCRAIGHPQLPAVSTSLAPGWTSPGWLWRSDSLPTLALAARYRARNLVRSAVDECELPPGGATVRVLIVGSGAREHALAWKLSRAEGVDELYAAPGNPGMAALAHCVPIAADAIVELAEFAASLQDRPHRGRARAAPRARDRRRVRTGAA